MTTKLELLFTLDAGYIQPFKVALNSIHMNSNDAPIRVWLIHDGIDEALLEEVRQQTALYGWDFEPVTVNGDLFNNAPTEARYPREMYFRLLAGNILPDTVHKVLYLDPDILVINSLLPLWNTDLDGHMLTASTHTGVIDVTTTLNKLRLNTEHGYFNSGIMLMDLDQARTTIKWDDIKRTIDEYGDYLMLPDQDILNHLYGSTILEVPDEVWNYDARNYVTYLTRSLGKQDIHWVMANTAILHFNGKPKPWSDRHDNRFTALYLNYAKLTEGLGK